MAATMFLLIDGLKGESTDSEHKDWIEALSYGESITQTIVTSGSGGSAAGRAHQEFTITKVLDISSPKLYAMCSSGTHISKVVLELTRTSGSRVTYLKVELDQVILSSVTASGTSQTIPVETVAFQFGQIHWTYTPQNATGSAGTAVTSGWDLAANKATS